MMRRKKKVENKRLVFGFIMIKQKENQNRRKKKHNETHYYVSLDEENCLFIKIDLNIKLRICAVSKQFNELYKVLD